MDLAALEGYSVSPLTLLIALLLSVLFGAALLMLVVRWTEGFVVSFWVVLKSTALAVILALVGQMAVFAVLFSFGYNTLSAYWVGLAATLVLAVLVNTLIYAYGVTRPTGERIGLARAVKVTFVQLALSVALALAIAMVVGILIATGVIQLPDSLIDAMGSMAAGE